MRTSPPPRPPFGRPLLLALVSLVLRFATLGLGCASGEIGFAARDAGGAGDDAGIRVVLDDATSPPPPASDETAEGGASAPAPGPAPGANEAGVSPVPVPPGPPFDAGEGGVCTEPLAEGGLRIVELMVESTSGTGDHGEWIEVVSTLDCALNLDGLTGDCATGAKVNTFTVSGNVWIPPLGRFVIADSNDPVVNHGLPGPVIPWSGKGAGPGDVLRNDGATVTILMQGVRIDSVTYPKLPWTPGVSIAFPADCPEGARADWSSWQSSSSSWFPGFLGTPNAPNDDVQCPPQPDDGGPGGGE